MASSGQAVLFWKCKNVGRHHQRICGSHQNNFHNKHQVKNVMKAMLESKSAAQKRATPPRAREPARLSVNATQRKIRMKYKYKFRHKYKYKTPPQAREPARLSVNAMLCIISVTRKMQIQIQIQNPPGL